MTALVECAGCFRPIRDRFLLKVLDKDWHPSCVRCQLCRKLLDEKCFYKEGKIYCKDDFYRCFGPKCGGCGETIHHQDFVRKARDKVYHLRCFTCTVCSKQLSTGEVLYLQPGDDSLVCKDDYLRTHQEMSFSEEEDDCDDPIGPIPGFDPSSDHHRLHMGATPPHTTPCQLSDTVSNHSLTPTPNKYENNNNLSSSEKEMLAAAGGAVGGSARHESYVGGNDDDDDDDLLKVEEDGKSPEDDGPGGKRRGPRTTIKAKQLEVLKAAFSQTPKPTRHIREQLAKETGLTMRVIQVWFQNKRSKERRMKQMTNGMMTGRGFFPGKGGRRGFPMMADEYGYFSHDKPFNDYGYPNFPPPPDGFFPPGHMGFIGGPGGPPPNLDHPLPMHGPPPPGTPLCPPPIPGSGPVMPPGSNGDPFPAGNGENPGSLTCSRVSRSSSNPGGSSNGSESSTPTNKAEFAITDLPQPRPSPDFQPGSGGNASNASDNSSGSGGTSSTSGGADRQVGSGGERGSMIW